MMWLIGFFVKDAAKAALIKSKFGWLINLGVSIIAAISLYAGFSIWLGVHDSRTADRAVDSYKAQQINNAYKIRKRQDAIIPPSVSDTVNSMRDGSY